MFVIAIYLIGYLLLMGAGIWVHGILDLPQWYQGAILPSLCALLGGVGGSIYCLRGVYRNKCVLDRWDKKWHIWYFLRPPVSTAIGATSYIFLRAGLLVLDAEQQEGAAEFGYYALAFIAGYNVDKFLKKLESIAQSLWGLKESRSNTESKKDIG